MVFPLILLDLSFMLGGLSSADWSVRRPLGDGSMPTMDSTVVYTGIPSAAFTRSGRQRKVLENRDLCRIVVSFVPK